MALRKKIAFQAMLMSKLGGNPTTTNDEENSDDDAADGKTVQEHNNIGTGNASAQQQKSKEEMMFKKSTAPPLSQQQSPSASSGVSYAPRPPILLPVSSEASFISAGRPASWRSSTPSVLQVLNWIVKQCFVTPIDIAMYHHQQAQQQQQSVPAARSSSSINILEGSLNLLPAVVSPTTTPRASGPAAGSSGKIPTAGGGHPPDYLINTANQLAELCFRGAATFLADSSILPVSSNSNGTAAAANQKMNAAPPPFPFSADAQADSMITSKAVQLLATHMGRLLHLLSQDVGRGKASPNIPSGVEPNESITDAYVSFWDVSQHAAVIVWRDRRGAKLLHRALTAVGLALRQSLLPSTFCSPISLSSVFDGHAVSIVWVGALCATTPVPLDAPCAAAAVGNTTITTSRSGNSNSSSNMGGGLVAPVLNIVSAIIRPLHFNDELRQQRQLSSTQASSSPTTAASVLINRQEPLLAAYAGYASRYWVLPSETFMNCMSDTVFRTEWLLPDFIAYNSTNGSGALGGTSAAVASPTVAASSPNTQMASSAALGESRHSLLSMRLERLVDTLFGMALRTFPIPVVQRAGAFLRSVFHNQGVPMRELLEVRRLLLKRDVNPRLVLSVERVRKLQAEMCSLMASEAMGRALKELCLLPVERFVRECLAPACIPAASNVNEASVPPLGTAAVNISASASKKLILLLPSLKSIPLIASSLAASTMLTEQLLCDALRSGDGVSSSSLALQANIVVQLFERSPAFISHVVSPRVVNKFPVRAEHALIIDHSPAASTPAATTVVTNNTTVMSKRDVVGYLRHALGVDFTPSTTAAAAGNTSKASAAVAAAPTPPVIATSGRSPRQVLIDSNPPGAAGGSGTPFALEASAKSGATPPSMSAAGTPRSADPVPPPLSLPPAAQNVFLANLNLFSVQSVFVFGGVNATFTLPNFVVCSYADRTQALITDIQRCGGFAVDVASASATSLSVTVAAAGVLLGISLANIAEAFGLKAGTGAREMALRTVRSPPPTSSAATQQQQSSLAVPFVYHFLFVTTRVVRSLGLAIPSKDKQQSAPAAVGNAPSIPPVSILASSSSVAPRSTNLLAVSEDGGGGITPTPTQSQRVVSNGSLISATALTDDNGNSPNRLVQVNHNNNNNNDTASTGSGSNLSSTFDPNGSAHKRHSSSVIIIPSGGGAGSNSPQMAWKQLQKILSPVELVYMGLLRLLPIPPADAQPSPPSASAAKQPSPPAAAEAFGVQLHPSDALWAQELLKRVLQQGLPLPADLQKAAAGDEYSDAAGHKPFQRRLTLSSAAADTTSGVFFQAPHVSSGSLTISTSIGNGNDLGTAAATATGDGASSINLTVTASDVALETRTASSTPRVNAAVPTAPVPPLAASYGLPTASAVLQLTIPKKDTHDATAAASSSPSLSNDQRQVLCRSWLQVLRIALTANNPFASDVAATSTATDICGLTPLQLQSYAPLSESILRYLWYGLITNISAQEEPLPASSQQNTTTSVRRKSVANMKDAAAPRATVVADGTTPGSNGALQQLLFGGQWDHTSSTSNVDGMLIGLCLAVVSQRCTQLTSTGGDGDGGASLPPTDAPSSTVPVLTRFWDPTVTTSLVAQYLRMVTGRLLVAAEGAVKKPSVPKANSSATAAAAASQEPSVLPSQWMQITTLLLAVASRSTTATITIAPDDKTLADALEQRWRMSCLALTCAFVSSSPAWFPSCCSQQLLQALYKSPPPSYFPQTPTTSCAAPWGIEAQQLPQMMTQQVGWLRGNLIPALMGAAAPTTGAASTSRSSSWVLMCLANDVVGHSALFSKPPHPSASSSSALSLHCSPACKTKSIKALLLPAAATVKGPRAEAVAISAVMFDNDEDATPATPITSVVPATPPPPPVSQELLAELRTLEVEVQQFFTSMAKENILLERETAELQAAVKRQAADSATEVARLQQEKKIKDEQRAQILSQVQLAQEELDAVAAEVAATRLQCDDLEHANALQREANIKNAGLEHLAKELKCKESDLAASEQRISAMLQKPSAAASSSTAASSNDQETGETAAADSNSAPTASVTVTTTTHLGDLADLTKDQFELLKQKRTTNAQAIANLTTVIKSLETEYVPPASYSSWHDKKMVDQQSELLAQRQALLVKILQKEESILNNCDPKREQPRPVSFCQGSVGIESNAEAIDGIALPVVDGNVVATLQPSAAISRRRSSVAPSLQNANSSAAAGSQSSPTMAPIPPAGQPTAAAAVAGESHQEQPPPSHDVNDSSMSHSQFAARAGRRRLQSPAGGGDTSTSFSATTVTDSSPRSDTRNVAPPGRGSSSVSTATIASSVATEGSPQPRNGRRATSTRRDEPLPGVPELGGLQPAATGNTNVVAQQKQAEDALLATILGSTSANGPQAATAEPSWI